MDGIREIIDGHHEWLLVRESGRSFALTNREFGVEKNEEGFSFHFLDDDGFHSRMLNSFSLNGKEVAIDVAGSDDEVIETMRLVPRIRAADLSAEVELARLETANEIAGMIIRSFTGFRVSRVALNAENGRLAQIEFENSNNDPMAAIADISSSLTVESVFTAAVTWLEKLGQRKRRPVLDIWIICEKRQAKNAQKLHALLNGRWKTKISIFQVIRKVEPPVLSELPRRRVRDLWREKAQKLSLPVEAEKSRITDAITALCEDKIDAIYSRSGETLRFHGLPFARVRATAGQERAWFGIGRERRLLTDESWNDLITLVEQLDEGRTAAAANRRHEYYRSSPEAWLESILRRHISALDSNLILSPIYNQFRSSNDKIDLLALRRDGRLVIIELKTQPDRDMVYQAADYWRKIEHQRRRGILAAANLFDGREIIDRPALVYLAAPAWSFHRDFEFFANTLSPEIELWRFELHEGWRASVKVLARRNYTEFA